MNKPIMKCGHTANATQDGKPVCVICAGLNGEYNQTNEKEIDLSGRKAKCPDCGHFTDSKLTLPFFEHRPDKDFDSYYCGCRGWD